MQPREQPTWRTCVHEAGHTVGYLATGVMIDLVTVDGDRGLCHRRGSPNVIGALAGCAAELRVTHPGRTPTAADLLRYRHATDFRHVRRCIGLDDGALLVACWHVARRVVDADWSSVERIAGALERRGRLTGEQVVDLWRGARRAA